MQPGRLSIRSYDGKVHLHRHPFHQVVLPLRGAMEMRADGRDGVVTGARGAFVPADTDHLFFAPTKDRFIIADLPAAWPGDTDQGETPELFFAIAPQVRQLIGYLDPCGDSEMLPASLQAAWCRLLGHALLRAGVAAPDNSGHRIVARANAFMRGNLGQNVTVDDIARASGASATRLQHLFRQQTGQTVRAALDEMRMEAAAHLLTATDLPIAEIAFRVGYGDQSALTRRLKSMRGLTPAALRRGATSATR